MPTGDPPLSFADLRDIELTRLKGVGPALAEKLHALGLENVLDLLQHYPRRWVDRTKRADIAELRVGEEATVFAEVRSARGRRTRQGRSLVEVVVHDGTSLLSITFFNQPWRDKQLTVGTEAAFFGKLDVYRGKRQMTNPVVDVIGRAGATDDKTGVIVPVYPQSGKAEVFTWQLRALVSDALGKCAARGFAEPLDTAILDREDLVDRTTALRAIHRPESMGELEAAKKRLIFDEFLRMQVGLVARKRALAAEQSGIEHDVDGGLVPAFIDNLPFPLTGDQARTIAEIMRDLAGPAPMHRLLQGDVGSGKTVVALAALLVGGPGRVPGRAHGAHRGARRTALPRVAAPCSTGSRSPQPARCWRSDPCASSCSPTAPPPPNAGDSAPRSPRARSTSSSARTRCSTATPSSRVWVSR